MEENVLKFWKKQDIFKKTVEQRKGKPEYVFYEGPPTANGRPGVHHVLARAFKDMFPRYKIMRGYHVSRRGGWDTHGLPVEIEVEKQLGFNNKQQIEEYGIDKFNELCRKSVFTYIQDWEKLTDRIAFWVDLETAYVTYDKRIHRIGLVDSEKFLGEGPALQGLQDRAVLPALRHASF